MEKSERHRVVDKVDSSTLSPSKDDSLADFKSPKTKPIAQLTSNVKILNDNRGKKSSIKGKTLSTSKKKESTVRRTNKAKAQPSIESSFFNAANNASRNGHTCPLCMKYFSDVKTGTAHSKTCATKNNISTRKLLAAVALQERQGTERLAIGLPAGPFVQPREKIPRRIRGPVSKADPDLQLALALSESLQENELEREFEEALLLAAEHRGDEPIIEMTDSQRKRTLKNFGFSTNKPAVSAISDGPVKSRRKKHLGPTILQTRTQESRDRLLTERIAEILMGNEAITQICQQANSDEVERIKKPKSFLRSRLLNKIHRTTKRLWDSAELSTAVTNFYVEDLAALVLPIVDRQQENSNNPIIESNDSEKKKGEENFSCKSNENESVIHKNVPSGMSDSFENCPSEIVEIPIVESRNINITDRQYRNALPIDWSNTLNVSSLSDVVILVKNNYIWAHKLVFHVRCSDILLDCEPNEGTKYAHVKEQISWPDVDFLTGLAFLEFVYSGLIEKNSHIFDDNRMIAGVRRLARKYRLKDLFDYLRKRKAEIVFRNDVELRRDGLSSPIVVDANEMQWEMDKLRNNEIQENHVEDKIQENHIQDKNQNNYVTEKIQENLTVTVNIENFSSRSLSPREKLIESSTTRKSNDSLRKMSEEREIETIEVMSVSSNQRDSTMSPDLFNETLQETEITTEDIKNREERIEEMSQESTGENSNLRILAQLIADGDTSSEESSQEFSTSTTNESKIANKIPKKSPVPEPNEDSTSGQTSDESATSMDNKNLKKSLKQYSKKKRENSILSEQMEYTSLSRGHVETPRSRGNIVDTSKITELSRSRGLPEKQKSNLSLFIEKVKKINAKPALDSYTDDDSLGGTIDRQRFRNPFCVNNASNQSIENFDEKKNRKGYELMGEKKKNHDESSVDESMKLSENSPTRVDDHEEFDSIDETIDTDDGNISMYSKYKKTSNHNDSIVNYRNILKRLNQFPGKTKNEENNENDVSSDDIAIDLTQESDEDVPASSTSSVNPPNVRKSNNRIFDTDSNDSLSLKNNFQAQLKPVIRNNISDITGNFVKDLDSESSITSSPLFKRNTERKRTKSLSSSNDDLTRNLEVTENRKNSLEFPDFDLFEVDEEILLQKHSSLSPNKKSSPSSNSSSPVPKKSNSRGELKADESTRNRSIDNLEISEKIEDHLTMRSSWETENPRNSSDYPDSDVFDVAEEIFTQSLRNSEQSPKRILTPSPRWDLSRTKSSRRKRKTDETRSRRGSLSYSTKNENEGPECGNNPAGSSPEYPYFDLSKRNEEIFTQSFKNYDNTPSGTLTPSPHRDVDSSRKTTLYRRKGNSDEERTKNTSLDGLELDEEEYCIDGFSPEMKGSRTANDHPELDFFDRNEVIFTQNFKNPDESNRSLTRSSSRETLQVPNLITISSSPELDADFEKHLASSERDSNKENAIKRNESPVNSRQCEKDAVERLSPLCLEATPSPRPSISRRRYSPKQNPHSSNSVRKLMSRSISMPASTSNSEANRKITRTPKKSSRLIMSQDLTHPNYDAMDTPELKRELEKYGIKPQKRKRARQLLNHIYNELHSITSSTTSPTNDIVEESDDDEPPSKKIGKTNERTSTDSESDREISLSQDSTTSQASNIVPEEMDFPDVDKSPKKIVSQISIKEAFTALLKSDKQLHNKLLIYEPLPLETLQSMLKAQGFKCNQNNLMDFLDEECITFQVLAQLSKTRAKNARGKKNSKRKEKSKSVENITPV